MKRTVAIVGLVVVLLLGIGGCRMDAHNLLQSPKNKSPQLVKVQIYFTDNRTTSGYVENVGIEKDSKVYTGGTSVNYLYDQKGNIIGCFNYQHVIYMKILH